MDRSEALPKISFVINLESIKAGFKDLACLRHVIQIFESQGLPLSWGMSVSQIGIFKTLGLNNRSHGIALSISTSEGQSSKHFQSELQTNLTNLNEASSDDVTMILGKASHLRNRAAILAREGIGAILDPSLVKAPNPKPLPCGLWQLQPAMRLPQPSSIWKLLSKSKMSLNKLTAFTKSIVLIDAGELNSLNARKILSIENFLKEISHTASRGQISVSTVSCLISDLADQRKIKPQRSILRRAA